MCWNEVSIHPHISFFYTALSLFEILLMMTSFAWAEILMCTAMLFWRFEFELCGIDRKRDVDVKCNCFLRQPSRENRGYRVKVYLKADWGMRLNTNLKQYCYIYIQSYHRFDWHKITTIEPAFKLEIIKIFQQTLLMSVFEEIFEISWILFLHVLFPLISDFLVSKWLWQTIQINHEVFHYSLPVIQNHINHSSYKAISLIHHAVRILLCLS